MVVKLVVWQNDMQVFYTLSIIKTLLKTRKNVQNSVQNVYNQPCECLFRWVFDIFFKEIDKNQKNMNIQFVMLV